MLCLRGKAVASRVRVPIEGQDDQHLVQAIQKALSSSGLKPRRCAVAMPSRDVLFRFFTIPNVPKQELDAAVQFEARKYIPFKIDALVWDYYATPAGTPNRLDVVFAAVPKDIFQHMHALLEEAGIQPAVLEPSCLSLARLIEPAKNASSNEFTCLIDVEADAAHLAIVKNRLPYLTRDINLRGFRPAAQEPPAHEEATVGAADAGPQPAPGPAADSRAERLLSELSVSMDFFMREHPSTSIKRVAILGDETVVGPWCGWLAEQSRCAVELGRPLIDQRVHGELPLSFASAVGLLQKPGSAAGSAINFLKRGGIKHAPAKAALGPASAGDLLEVAASPQGAVFGMVVAGLLGAAWLGGAVIRGAERSRLDQLVRSRPRHAGGLEQMSSAELGPLKEQAEAQLAILKRVIDQRVSAASKLDALARALPEGMWLLGLDFENRLEASGVSRPKLVVNGACFLGEAGREISAIQQFERQIKDQAGFFAGFVAAQVEQINAQADATQTHTFRTFQLSCTPKPRKR